MPCFGKKKSIVPVDEDAVGRLEGDGAKNGSNGAHHANGNGASLEPPGLKAV